ncbi:MAG: hypothetical protein V1661_00820 [bacterium]
MEYEFVMREYGSGVVLLNGNFQLTEEQEKFINICRDSEFLFRKLKEASVDVHEIEKKSKIGKQFLRVDKIAYSGYVTHFLIYKAGEDESKFTARGVVEIREGGGIVYSPHNEIVFGNKFGQAD